MRGKTRKRPQSTKLAATAPLLTGGKRNALISVALAVASIALYAPTLGYRFVMWDDHDYVTANPHIRRLGWNTVKWAFTTTHAANWHPLTWLSHAVDCQLFALHPAGHHFHNVLLHAANVVLLFLLLSWMTKRTGPSLLVAALFAVHPLNVESVAWVAERKNLLSTLFFFLAIGAYVRYAQKPDWRRYSLVAVLFAAGLMAKPIVITLPFVLLLLDYWPLERLAVRSSLSAFRQRHDTTRSDDERTANGEQRFLWLVLEKLPLLVLSAASAWITVIAQRSGYAVRSLQEFPLATRIENVPVAYALYLWKTIWPARLAALYPHPAQGAQAWQVMLAMVVLIGITVLVPVFRDRRYLAVGWFWFLGTLVPVIGLVQVGEAAMADRYAYLPLIGIFIMIAWGLDDWANAKNVATAWRLIPGSCVIAVLAFTTLNQSRVWASEYSLWAHAAAVTAPNPYAEAIVASALLNPDEGMSADDLQSFDTAAKRLDEARRQYDEAIASYRQLVQQSPDTFLPDMAAALGSLGDVARLEGHLDEARQHYEEALRYYRQLSLTNPSPHQMSIAGILSSLADVNLRQNHFDEARAQDEEALNIYRQLELRDPGSYQPKIVDLLVNLGFEERALGQPSKANAYFEEALQSGRQLARQNPDVYVPSLAGRLINLGSFDAEQNKFDDARRHYEEALGIYRQLAQQKPAAYLADEVTALNDLGNLDLGQNRTEEARKQFSQALDLLAQLAQRDWDRYSPELAWELNTLGRANGILNRLEDARQQVEEASKIYRQLAQQNPRQYMPELAATLNNLGLLDRLLKRPGESRAHYTEAIAIYHDLAPGNPNQYAGDIARAEASLAQLGKQPSAQ